MRVLLVSNMYAYPGNWDKLDHLGRHIQLGAVMPSTWHSDKELHPVLDVPEKEPREPWQQYRIRPFFQGNPFRYVYEPKALERAIAEFKPDLIHAEQEPESLSLLQLSVLKPFHRYRLVFVAWENVHPLHQGLLFRQVNFLAADAGIVGSRDALNRTRNQGFRKRLEIIPQYGFEITAPNILPDSTDGPFRIGYAGRLVPEKGLRTLVEATRGMRDVEVVVAGSGPLAAELQREPHITLLGTLPRQKLDTLWRQVQVCVVPSLTTRVWAEQFGRVVVEAMAAGVPVIGSSSAAIPEVIGDAGLVFPEGNATALRREIERLHYDPSLRRDLASRGIARVKDCYSNEVIMQRTVEFYREVLGSR